MFNYAALLILMLCVKLQTKKYHTCIWFFFFFFFNHFLDYLLLLTLSSNRVPFFEFTFVSCLPYLPCYLVYFFLVCKKISKLFFHFGCETECSSTYTYTCTLFIWKIWLLGICTKQIHLHQSWLMDTFYHMVFVYLSHTYLGFKYYQNRYR